MYETQNTQVLHWLMAGSSITPVDAYEHLHCLRLSARIYDLRKRGHSIVTMWESDGRKRYARYTLEKLAQRMKCVECGTNFADYPSKLCPGCEAYRAHTGAEL